MLVSIPTPGCEFCAESEALVATVITEHRLADSEPSAENVYWLCANHYDKIIRQTDYHVRECPPDHLTDPPCPDTRKHVDDADADRIVIYTEGDAETWLEFPPDLETDCRENT